MILNNPYSFKFLKLLNNNEIIYNINKYIVTAYIYIKEREKLTIKLFENNMLKLNSVFLYGFIDVI